MEPIYMTAEGKKQLEERLYELKVNGRAEAAKKISEAREFGDLSENAEYDIAKDEQGKLEAEILDIEQKLKNVIIIDEKIKRDKIDVGSKVEIQAESGEVYEYTIVGTHESNPLEGRISNESPIGKALLGKRKGDGVVVSAPMGESAYKIINIK